MTEAELCLKLEEFFSDGDVYKEVPTSGGRCDMYVRRGALWISVEAKIQFNTDLIYQALRNFQHSHYAYVAVPDFTKSSAVDICKRLGIGVLEYVYKKRYMAEGWRIRAEASYRRKIEPLRVLDRMKNAIAGVQHNSESDFKVTLSFIQHLIQRCGGRMLIKAVFEKDSYHYSSTTSAKQCITRLCRQGKIKEFDINGKYFVLNSEQEAQASVATDDDSSTKLAKK